MRFMGKTTKCLSMQDFVSISLIFGAIEVGLARTRPSFRFIGKRGIRREAHVTSIAAEGDKVVVERTLEEEVEEIEVPLPAVIAVSPSIGEPRIPGMREILAAGKKPSTVDELAGGVDAKIEIEETKAPELAPRKQQIFEEGDIDAFAAAVAEALK